MELIPSDDSRAYTRENRILALALATGLVAYMTSVSQLGHVSRIKERESMNVSIPPTVQTILAGGDRFLAANIAVIRAVIVGTGVLDPITYKVLGRVQADAAIMNPYHEDNYYLAQAILPWEGEVVANGLVQEKAMNARVWDPMPAFFLGFNQYHFLHDPVSGAYSVMEASKRSDGVNRDYFSNMSARWIERADDPQYAIVIIKGLIKSTRDTGLIQLLNFRLQRMESLISLRSAVARFNEKNGHKPKDLGELISAGFLTAIPVDPLGAGYEIDKDGVPMLSPPIRNIPKK